MADYSFCVLFTTQGRNLRAMKTNLPTEPGPYWWRAKDGDEWQTVKVDMHLDVHLIGGDMVCSSEECGGQWVKIQTPDEGQEIYLVRNGKGQPVGAGVGVNEAIQSYLQCSTSPEFDFVALKNKSGYTCRKVKIVEVEE